MFAECLRERTKGLVVLSDRQVQQLDAHYQLMVRWNKSLNLTTITAVEEAVDRHYLESLFLGLHLPQGVLRIADVGSGPGFPGFPVAVFRPDCEITLIESHQRKAVFLKEASRELGNLRVIAKRAEAVESTFDWMISRAVSYKDLQGLVGKVAPRVSLLTGAETPSASWHCTWDEALAVPGGNARFLRRGVCLDDRV